MLFYYDKIFKDTVEHKIDYSTPDIMKLLEVNNENISPISLVHIANDGAGKAILRTQTKDIFSKSEDNNL